MAIRLLDEHVIAQIAAGEVVERPASVVKELLENALDAGAATVQVAIAGGGQRLIRISDDGSGIRSDEVELAFARHATSKLTVVDDLEHIRTLGFRGEALASIAAVSQITVTTRHKDEAGGTRLRIEGGDIVQRSAIGAPSGTIMTVENLFYNTPARLKFLKKEATERRHIASVVTHYAMAYPHVRFVLEQDGREVFRSTGSGALADVMVRAVGLDIFKQMIEVDQREDDGRVYGFTSLPELHRADRTNITLFVNGRAIQDQKLTYAVVQAYHNLSAAGQYPISVLMIDLPPEDVDVNVHPTKAEVRFRDPQRVFSGVQRAVRAALLAASGGAARPQPPSSAWTSPAQTAFDLGSHDFSAGSGRLTQRETYEAASAIPSIGGAPAKPRTLPVLRVIGQVGAMYIIAEGPAGMYLIDQHAAHCRALYDRLSDLLAAGEPVPQTIFDVITVTLPPRAAQTLLRWNGILGSYGLDVEHFGGDAFTVRALPEMLHAHEPQAVIAELAEALTRAASESDANEAVLQAICRMGAVKSGEIMSLDTMQALVRQLERCASPLTAPDGQTTLVHITGDQIARQFKRG
jgi:DNA mismatch repair protein MutL